MTSTDVTELIAYCSLEPIAIPGRLVEDAKPTEQSGAEIAAKLELIAAKSMVAAKSKTPSTSIDKV